MITTPRPTHQVVPGPTREVVRRHTSFRDKCEAMIRALICEEGGGEESATPSSLQPVESLSIRLASRSAEGHGIMPL
jgi:hypothetical protein